MIEFKKILRNLNMEPAIFLYMCASFMKYPVFMNLIYEKSCYARYDSEEVDCQNVSEIYDDKQLQTDANHFYLWSSIVLLVPSIVVSLILGSLCDSWNIKIPMLIPFVGHILGDLVYIILSTYMKTSPYLLLVSDFITGCSGGFTSIISTVLSYNIKMTTKEFRSSRVAGFEAAIGFGGTLGLIISGIFDQSFGYAYSFVFMMVLKIIGFLYIIFVAKDVMLEHGEGSVDEPIAAPHGIFSRLSDVFEFLSHYRGQPVFILIVLTLAALSVEMFVYAGISDILYSYLRYTLSWDDKPYGWFNGIASGLSSILVLFLYPLLHVRFKIHDFSLAIFGIFSKIMFLAMFAFLHVDWWAYLALIPLSFNRFVSAGLRAGCCQLVEDIDQGKLLSMISMIEGIVTILASLLFNGLYPVTLHFFPGTCFLAVAISMFIPIALTGKVKRSL